MGEAEFVHFAAQLEKEDHVFFLYVLPQTLSEDVREDSPGLPWPCLLTLAKEKEALSV